MEINRHKPGTMFHCHIAIASLLEMDPAEFVRVWGDYFREKETGRLLFPYEIRVILLEKKANGGKLLALGDCDNFDDQRGCMGHYDDR
jgi:hypothetical protein